MLSIYVCAQKPFWLLHRHGVKSKVPRQAAHGLALSYSLLIFSAPPRHLAPDREIVHCLDPHPSLSCTLNVTGIFLLYCWLLYSLC